MSDLKSHLVDYTYVTPSCRGLDILAAPYIICNWHEESCLALHVSRAERAASACETEGVVTCVWR